MILDVFKFVRKRSYHWTESDRSVKSFTWVFGWEFSLREAFVVEPTIECGIPLEAEIPDTAF